MSKDDLHAKKLFHVTLEHAKIATEYGHRAGSVYFCIRTSLLEKPL